MTLSDAFEPYMTYCKAEKLNAEQTLWKYRECYKTWIAPNLGARRLSDLAPVDVLGLRSKLAAKNLSVSRQYSILIVLKSLLRFCREVLKEKALNPSEIKLPRKEVPHVLALTNEEVALLLSKINPHTFSGARLRALIELLLGTGMRISEALALNRDVVDSGATSIEIVGKGRKVRTIFFNRRTLFWLKHWLRKRYDDDAAMFITTGYEPKRWAREDISRFFINLRDKAQIKKKITPHTLRHTYCTNLLNNGVDITFIKELAGHQDIQTTARYYLAVSKDKLRDVVNRHLNYDEVDVSKAA